VNSDSEGKVFKKKKKLGASVGIGLKPRVMTKSALQREAQQADQARQDFVAMREAVKATEVVIPFVFYDGTNIPGGRCRLKKGDHLWLFLDRARKVGAELGVGGDRSRRDWARVSVDDLMLVRGEVILPHVCSSTSRLGSWLMLTCYSTTTSTISCSTESPASTGLCLTFLHKQQKPLQ
jgi:protein FAM50